MDPKYFDPITAIAEELQTSLAKKKLTSVHIIIQYLHQIGKHNSNGFNLNEMISVVPKAKILAFATALDNERAEGILRSSIEIVFAWYTYRAESRSAGTKHTPFVSINAINVRAYSLTWRSTFEPDRPNIRS